MLLQVIVLLYTLDSNNMKNQSIFYLIFIASILFIHLDTIFQIDTTKNLEKRGLAKFPSDNKTFANFTKDFDSYAKDNFGFRKFLIKYNALSKYHIFKSVKKNVLVGKDDWMFLNSSAGEKDLIFRDYTNRNQLSKKEQRTILNKYRKRSKTLNTLGIKYYRGFYPNKHTIYKEMLPERALKCILPYESTADQILNQLFKVPHLTAFDFREELLENKSKHSLYIKGDTHWNEMGSFIAYEKIINQLSLDFPSIKPKKDYDVLWFNDMIKWKRLKRKVCKTNCYSEYIIGNDRTLYSPQGLIKMLGFESSKLLDSIPIFIPNFKNTTKKIKEIKVPGVRKLEIFENKKAGNNLTVLVFRDSYTLSLIKFLYPNFRKTIFIKGQFSINKVKQYNPDIILDIHVERHFGWGTNNFTI